MSAVHVTAYVLVSTVATLYPIAASAQVEPAAVGTPDSRILTVVYGPDRVLDVPVRRGQITQIVLGDDEQIVGVPLSGKGANCADDSHTWCIARQGQDLFIKPRTGATSTNLLVVTSRRRHAFLLHPIEGPGLTLMRLTVAAPRPMPQPVVSAAPVLVAPGPPAPRPPTAQELIDERWQVLPVVRNTAYSVATGKDSDDIVPVMVFDDGTQTYFSFPNNRPLPALFEAAADGSEEMVNTRMDAEGLLVADRVGRRFVLRLGQRVAAIHNEGFDLDGVAPKDGTTVAGVARVLRAPGAGVRFPGALRPPLPTLPQQATP